MPVLAVICGGTLTTSSGSRIAISGYSALLNSGYLMPLSGSLITQALVTSEPVPLVVGIATQVSMLIPPAG